MNGLGIPRQTPPQSRTEIHRPQTIGTMRSLGCGVGRPESRLWRSQRAQLCADRALRLATGVRRMARREGE